MEQKLTFRECVVRVFRRKGVFITFFLTLVAAVAGGSFVIKPAYRAEAMLLVEKSEDVPFVPLKVPITDFADRVSLITTQAEIIKSRTVLEKVVKELSLDTKLPIKGPFKYEKTLIFLKKSIKVTPVKNSDFITIRLNLNDKALVAPLVNSIAKHYIDYYFEIRSKRSGGMVYFIDSQIDVARGKLYEAQRALRDYEVANDIVSLRDDARISLEKLAEEQKRLTYLVQDFTELHPSVIASNNEIRSLKEKLAAFPNKKMELRQLEYNVSNLQDIYLMLLKKREEMRISAAMELEGLGQIRNILLVDKAVEPIKHVWPKRTINIILAIFFGFVGGAGLAVWASYLDSAFYSSDEIKEAVDLYPVGAIPLSARIKNLVSVPDDGLLDLYVESFNSIKAFSGAAVKTILVTSAYRQEGKTLTAVNLALALSRDSGKKVLIIDCDGENPTLHAAFNASNSTGLSDFLNSGTSSRSIVLSTSVSNLFLIPFGNGKRALLDLDRLRGLIDDVKRDFDYVIFDSSGCAFRGSVVEEAAMVDHILFVVKSGISKRGLVRLALDRIRSGSQNNASIIFNGQVSYMPKFLEIFF